MADQAQLETAPAPAAEALAPDDFQSLLKKEFRPRDAEAEGRIGAAVRTLAGNHPLREVAAEFGVSHETVRKVLHEQAAPVR